MINRLLTAAAVVALATGMAAGASAQTAKPAAKPATATAKTEAQAKAATGKASTDAPAATAVQGTAKAVKEGAAPAATTTPQASTPAAATGPKIAAQGDLVDTLRLSGQFNTFLKGVDSTNLTTLLKTTKTLTVFAPTDAAFAAMAPADLARLQGDKAAMQKFILHHVINAPVPSTKIKGAKGPVPSGAGDQVVLDGSDESGALHADGATIVQADLQTSSGLVHVVDHVLVAGAVSATATAAPAAATAPAPK